LQDGNVVDDDPDRYDEMDIAAGAALWVVSKKDVVLFRILERVP
jgi:hypothetical protein